MPDRSSPYDPLRIVVLGPSDAGLAGLPAAVASALDSLAADGVLELVLPFEPRPLVEALAARGCPAVTERRNAGWLLRTGKQQPPPVEGLTGLEPPEPMQRVLAAAHALAPGKIYLAELPHTPVPLFPHLVARGLTFATHERPDGTALLWIRR